MDVVTHGLAGALVARAGGGRASWPLVAAAVGGALAPDLETQLVELRDLAFEDHPFGGPMTLRIRLDRSGAVRASELGHKR